MRSYTASPGRYTNTGRRIVLSLWPLVSGSHLFAVFFGSTVDTFMSVYSGLWEVQFLDKVCLHFVVQRQEPGFPDIPVVRRGSSRWSSTSYSWCSSRTRLLRCPSLCNDRCRSSAVVVLTVVDTPVFAQWLIPMVLTIEIYSYSLTRWFSSLLCRLCGALRCRVVVKVSLLLVLTIMHGPA